MGLCDPGDEVVVFEPYYDSYAACVAFAGATCRFVTMRPPDFALDPDALRAAIEGGRGRVRAVLLELAAQPDRPGAEPRGAPERWPTPASSTT